MHSGAQGRGSLRDENDVRITAKKITPVMKGVIDMSNKLVYDTLDCMRLIKKKYPLIPICIIRRVLFAEDVYMHKIGIIDWIPKLNHWSFKK